MSKLCCVLALVVLVFVVVASSIPLEIVAIKEAVKVDDDLETAQQFYGGYDGYDGDFGGYNNYDNGGYGGFGGGQTYQHETDIREYSSETRF